MLSLLTSNQYLAAALQLPGHELRTNLPHWTIISVPSWSDCDYLIKSFRHTFMQCAESRMPLYLEYGSGNEKYLCCVAPEGNIMDININGLPCNRALLDVFGEILANPERSLGLVRLRDEKQITVSGGSDGRFLCGATVEQTEQWVRADYWEPKDLFNFNRDWQREMSVGGGWFERQYRTFDPLAPAYRRGPEFCDFMFVSRYKLIEGPRGELYHLAENLGMEEITV